jgi:NitT/TauT family transport system substrate-binding protein
MLAGLLALTAAARYTPAVAQDAAVLRVGIAPQDADTPLLYAMKAGIYAKYGLQVELTGQTGGSTLASALAGGSLDLAASSTLAVVTAVSRGVPFTIVGNLGFYDAKTPDIALIVSASSSIKRPKDLEGKVFGARYLDDLNSVATFAWLDRNGVDRSTIKFVEVPPAASLAAIEQGRIDAATVYEPFLSQFDASGKVRILAYPYGALGSYFSDAVIFGDSKWVAANPALISRFLRASAEASAYVKSHEPEAARVMADWAHVDASSFANVRHAARGIALKASDLQPVIDAAAKYKVISTAMSAQTMICSCAI